MGHRERAERPLNPVPGVLCLATHVESQALLARLLKEYTEVMANVATVFLRIVSAGERAVAVSHAAIVRALLGEDDSSYCVPLVIGFRDRCTDVQIGRRWSPGELAEDLLETLGDGDHRIFVRWHSSGGDFDEIYEVDGTGRQAPRGCRYAFDEIAVRYRVRPEDAPPPDELGFSVYPVSGTYLGGNNRFADSFAPFTLTTPAGTSSPAAQFEPASAARLIAALASEGMEPQSTIHTIEWRHQRRAVRIERRFQRSRTSQWGLDDWDNCADGAYLLSRGRAPVVPNEVAALDREFVAEDG